MHATFSLASTQRLYIRVSLPFVDNNYCNPGLKSKPNWIVQVIVKQWLDVLIVEECPDLYDLSIVVAEITFGISINSHGTFLPPGCRVVPSFLNLNIHQFASSWSIIFLSWSRRSCSERVTRWIGWRNRSSFLSFASGQAFVHFG